MSDGLSSEIKNLHCDSGSDRELRGFLRVELVFFFFHLIGHVGGGGAVDGDALALADGAATWLGSGHPRGYFSFHQSPLLLNWIFFVFLYVVFLWNSISGIWNLE